MYTSDSEAATLIPDLRNRFENEDDTDSEVEYKLDNNNTRNNARPSKAIGFVILITCLAFLYIPLNYNVIKHRSTSIIGWSFNTSRNIRRYIRPEQNSTILEPLAICDIRDKILLLVVVCSAAKNFDARDSIRSTWKNERFNYHPYFKQFHPKADFDGKYLLPNDKTLLTDEYLLSNLNEWNTTNDFLANARFNVKVIFLLGKAETTPDYDGFNGNLELQSRITNESVQFGDIIQEDFVDSYNNLTLKSVFLLKWVTNNCIDKVKFLVKCDDDTFLNIPNLLHVLTGGTIPIYNATIAFYDKLSINNKVKRNRLLTKNVLTGFLFCGVKPVSDPQNKWYSPIYMYNGEFYPNYLSGTAYLMSIDVVERLYKASLETPLFHLEDVFITGIVADRIKLKRKSHPLFYYSTTKDKCGMRGMIAQHQLSPSDIIAMYEYITNTTIRCLGPSKKFTSTKMKLMNRRKCQ